MSTILEKSEEIFHPDCKVIGRHWGELKVKVQKQLFADVLKIDALKNFAIFTESTFVADSF